MENADLIRMANQITAFFTPYPKAEAAIIYVCDPNENLQCRLTFVKLVKRSRV